MAKHLSQGVINAAEKVRYDRAYLTACDLSSRGMIDIGDRFMFQMSPTFISLFGVTDKVYRVHTD